MKKFICAFISMLMLFGISFSASAGSIPWDIAEYDEAVLYFGQVKKVYYSSNQAVIKPLKVIKGDVPIDGSLIIENIGLLTPLIPGNTYIFAGVLEDAGQLDIFFPDSYDTETLKLAERGSFWEEVQKRINSGRYKDTDNLRIDRINEFLVTGTALKLSEVCGISKDNPKAIKSDYIKDADFDEFYSLLEGIDAFPVDRAVNIDNRLIAMTVETENSRIDITSDGKIQVCLPLERSIYVISTADRDRLLSLLPEENLPFIHLGTVLTAAGAVLIISAVAGIIIFIRVKKKKK